MSPMTPTQSPYPGEAALFRRVARLDPPLAAANQPGAVAVVVAYRRGTLPWAEASAALELIGISALSTQGLLLDPLSDEALDPHTPLRTPRTAR